MGQYVGVIYPLHKHVIDFMFSNKRDVFVKYTSRQPNKKNIKIHEGMKLFIYESGGSKSIIGEAIIKNIQYLDLYSILNSYPERTMIPEDELKAYAAGREEKKALVLELSYLMKYETPVKLLKPITMTGLYLTDERKKELLI